MEVLKKHKTFGGETRFYEHQSSVTKTPMRFSIYMPSSGKPDGCILWLSGLTCNEENFITKAGAQKYLEELNLMVVCPDTSPRGLELANEHDSYDFGSGAGFYLNATTDGYRDHYQMENYLIKELYPLLDNEFSLQGKISITGHSMGGHGALTLGLKHPAMFKSISAFSPITNPKNCDWGKKAFKGYFGEDVSEEVLNQHDACELILSGSKHEQKILIDQGLDDEFFPAQLLTKNFQEACDSKGQKTEINLVEGYDHSYYFISTFIENHLRFHKSNF